MVALGQDTRDNVVRVIGLEHGIQGRVEVFEDRGGTEAGLEFFQHLLAGRCPFDRGFLGTLFVGNRFWGIGIDGFQQVEQWAIDPQVSFNEPAVEVCEFQKTLNILNGCRFFPFHDSRDLLRVHVHQEKWWVASQASDGTNARDTNSILRC